ncbi:MAG: YcxB family protein [Lachnospiraceae bacterium]|nr:YcxB family protein [Lachnospiraceae bacterium]
MIINKFKFTKELVKEHVLYYWMKYVIGIGGIAVILFAYYLYLFLVSERQPELIVFVCVLLIPVVLCVRINKDIKNILERNRVQYGDEAPVYTVEMDEEIVVTVNEISMHISPDNIKKYVQTKNLLVLYINGSMAVVLKKDSFVQGSVEECIKWVKKYKK